MKDLTPTQAKIVITIAILLGLFGDNIYNAIFNF
jgi:hypothetical protein